MMIASYRSGSPPRFPIRKLGGLLSGMLTIPMYTEKPLSPKKKGVAREPDVKEGLRPRSGRVKIYDQTWVHPVYIFFSTRRGMDTEEEQKRNGRKWMQNKKGHSSESEHSRAEVNTFPSPGSLVCRGLLLSKPSTRPPFLPPSLTPEARASHQSTWPPPCLLICVSASDCTKTSGPGGRDTSKAGQDVEGSRGELGDEGSASRKTMCSRRRRRGEKECQLPALQKGGGLSPRGWLNFGENLRKHFCSDGVWDKSRCFAQPCTPSSLCSYL